MNTVSRETNKPLPSGKGIPGPFSLADERVLKDALLESGFKDVATESMIVTCNFNSPQEYTRLHQAISAPIHAMIANETQEREEEIWNAVTAEITKYANDTTGSLRLHCLTKLRIVVTVIIHYVFSLGPQFDII
jgi:hypothetical protein